MRLNLQKEYKDFQACLRSIDRTLSTSLKTLRSSFTSQIILVSHTELVTAPSLLFDIFPDPLNLDSFLIGISSNEKVCIVRSSNQDEAQMARHTLKNQGPISQLSFNSLGQLLLISTEEMSSHFRTVNIDNLVWENVQREEVNESIAGYWSESGLAISSFMPKGYDNKSESHQYSVKKRHVSFMGNGSLFDLDKKSEDIKKDLINVEIPLQNVNNWKNNSRGINFVFTDNKLIVFKIKE
jgi:hypothetical protein